jgi:hypothetical protein
MKQLEFSGRRVRRQAQADASEVFLAHLQDAGLLLRQGTIVDATIITAPSSTKNSTGQRDPEARGGMWR